MAFLHHSSNDPNQFVLKHQDQANDKINVKYLTYE